MKIKYPIINPIDPKALKFPRTYDFSFGAKSVNTTFESVWVCLKKPVQHIICENIIRIMHFGTDSRNTILFYEIVLPEIILATKIIDKLDALPRRT